VSRAWPRVRLGAVLTPVIRAETVDASREYPLLGVRLEGQGPFLRETVRGTETAATKLFRVAEGDFIYSRLFAWRGAFGLVGSDLDGCYVSGEFPIFRPIEDRLDSRFLNYWFRLSDTLSRVSEDCTGSTPLTRNRFKEQFFLALEIPLPPLTEQRRIVARMEQLAAKIEEARGLRRQSVEEAEIIAETEIVSLFSTGANDGWAKTTLGDYVMDCCYGTLEKTTDDDSGIPILRMGNIQSGRLNYSDLKYLHLTERERERLLLKRGDILVNRTNSAELVGKCAVFDANSKFAFASYLIRLRLDTNRADPNLIAAYINSSAGRAYMFRERKQMTGQANVNSIKLKDLPILLPPIEEQRRIVAYLDDLQARVNSLKHLQTDTAAEFDALLPSVLDKAFKREL